ncbi:prohibitin family protein [Microscilla marina]|uniref:Band 7 protein n=1 Tax=Microscilla marina ATCC 23134 TaxID=313606 RepID=A1ZWN1_MICM2|nr:prohibitin family protein [Microscilla marina]EAY25163.1 band 7 protein [Microscilla marina ATCC 23134]
MSKSGKTNAAASALRSNGLKVAVGVLVLFLIFSLFSVVKTVPSGYVGVVTHFGAVQKHILGEGIHTVMPFRTKVVKLNVRIQKMEANATASSKDLQTVTSKVALNFYLSKEKANVIYQDLGMDYQHTIIQPTVQESIKSATARYNAEQLITSRPKVKQDVFTYIKKRLAKSNIIVTDFSIVDFKFSPNFNDAIEKKQIAEQRALTAKNDLNRIKTEAEQAKAKAKGEADAQIEIAKAQARSQELLRESVSDQLIQLKAIEKWNGVMPVSMGEKGSGGFFDITAVGKRR